MQSQVTGKDCPQESMRGDEAPTICEIAQSFGPAALLWGQPRLQFAQRGGADVETHQPQVDAGQG